MAFEFEKTSIVLNRFLVKNLAVADRTFCEYSCSFTQNPDHGQEQKAIATICYKLGVPAIRLGNKIITKELVDSDRLRGDVWEVKFLGKRILDCTNSTERQGVERLERKIIEQALRRWSRAAVEKASEGGLIWWVTGEDGKEKCGIGWEVHKGRRIDVSIDADSNLYLEIDLHHRFHTPWTLHEWQDEYPDIPISYVRNIYKDKNNNYITWQYEDVSEETPEQMLIEGLGITLAAYHRQIGATDAEIENSRVVYVKKANDWRAQLTTHLSRRLSPSLTMEMLANVAEKSDTEEKKNVQGVFD